VRNTECGLFFIFLFLFLFILFISVPLGKIQFILSNKKKPVLRTLHGLSGETKQKKKR
jgi:hypothetical protein